MDSLEHTTPNHQFRVINNDRPILMGLAPIGLLSEDLQLQVSRVYLKLLIIYECRIAQSCREFLPNGIILRTTK